MDSNYLKKSTLLYVEDEDEIREFLKKRLERKVKKLYIAKDGAEGLESFCENRPDFVLTDVTMPNLNGIDMAIKIRELDPTIPIIIMSAHSDTSYLLKAIELGVDNYLLKPIDKTKLYKALENSIKANFLEQELEENKKQILHQSRFALLGEMTSMIAHQWRQPLNTISISLAKFLMNLELDKYDLENPEMRKKFPGFVQSNLERIEDYIQDLSGTIDSFAKIYKPSDHLEECSINESISHALRAFKNTLSHTDIIIYDELQSNAKSNIYKNEFIQICLNLLNNAYEHFLEREIQNPRIDIQTKENEEFIEISIKDNAGGISDEIIEKIFDPYFSTKFAKNGNGLGLYMSKLIIEEHLEGKLSVENENDGAKFIIKLKANHD
ncbi:ATP-binding response regulator [Poseidonibacter lekithochrous]|uniref:ATP-binding response regulator n=1 Tax=Poseidonibacter lekithochrous TaxID=1904463 RepID=UPI000D3C6782|nr:response regulator [Poseidonibacter lekithochrous]